MEAVAEQLRLINERLTALEAKNQNDSSYRGSMNRNDSTHRGSGNRNWHVTDGPRGGFQGRREGCSLIFQRRPQGNREPIETRSNWTAAQTTRNDDLSSTLFHAIRLRHHARNWDRTPINVAKKFDDIFKNLYPPMPTTAFRDQLTQLNNESKTRLTTLMKSHVDLALEQLRTKLKSFRPTPREFDQAANAARGRALHHFRRKITAAEINGWIAEDLRIVEGGTEAMANANINESEGSPLDGLQTDGWMTVTSTRAKRRRSAGSLNDSPILPLMTLTNRFEGLTNENDTTSAGYVDDGDFPPLNITGRTPPANKKSRTGGSSPTVVLDQTISDPMTSNETPTEVTEDDEKEAESAIPTADGVETLENNTQDVMTEDKETVDDRNTTTAETEEAITVATTPTTHTTSENDHTIDDAAAPGIVTEGDEEDYNDVDEVELTFTAPTETTDRTGESPTSGRSLSQNDASGSTTVHTGMPKHSWTARVGQNTKVVILGDSNMRLARNLPNGWEAHVYPGAHLNNMATIIQKMEKPDSLTTVVVAAGINNRTWQVDNIRHDIYKVSNVASNRNLTCHFVGVSIPPKITEDEKSHLRSLNKIASERFRHRYINSVSEVSVSPTDRYKIHYDQNTVDQIIGNIKTHFLSKIRGARGRKNSV